MLQSVSNAPQLSNSQQLATYARCLLMQPIREHMVPRQNLVVVKPEDPLKEVFSLMVRKGHGYAFLVKDDNLAGIITERDLLRHVAPRLMNVAEFDPLQVVKILNSPVSEFASTGVRYLNKDQRMLYAMRAFDAHEFRRFGVISKDEEEKQTFVGAVSERTVVRALDILTRKIDVNSLRNVSCSFPEVVAEMSEWADVQQLEQAGEKAEKIDLSQDELTCLVITLLGCPVGDIMKPLIDVPVFEATSPLRDVVHGMVRKTYGYAFLRKSPDSENACGIFTERDFLVQVTRTIEGCLPANPEKVMKVFDSEIYNFMTRSPLTISVESSLLTAIRLMGDKTCRRLPVVKNVEGQEVLLGAVSERTIVRHLTSTLSRFVHLGPVEPQSWDWSEGR